MLYSVEIDKPAEGAVEAAAAVVVMVGNEKDEATAEREIGGLPPLNLPGLDCRKERVAHFHWRQEWQQARWRLWEMRSLRPVLLVVIHLPHRLQLPTPNDHTSILRKTEKKMSR